MEVIPSVDLSGGKAVRLEKGKASLKKVYSNDPAMVAKRWEREGANLLHVVDIDAAKGLGNNGEVVRRILEETRLRVQVGGGIRSVKSAESLIGIGAERVVVGTIAFQEPHTLSSMLSSLGKKRVVVALDYMGDEVMVGGWEVRSNVGLAEALERFEKLGVKHFLLTSVERDGTMSGPDLETLGKVRKRTGSEIIASGGVKEADDLLLLRKIGVDGVVVGKALYEGRFTLQEALMVLSSG